jgi:hypothetical protein
MATLQPPENQSHGKLCQLNEAGAGPVKGTRTATMFCSIILSMTNKSSAFEVTCPCCNAVLKVDADDEAVIGHTAPPRVKTFNDIEEAARAMKEQDTRRDSIFRQSVEAQKHASDVLEKKFQEAVKKAKETPDTGKPLRDFDLD